MGKPPDYNRTVPNTAGTPENGTELEAYVGRESVVAVTGTPTASDAFPTDGRVAVDTSTSPDTYYIGDGSSWIRADVGSADNPETHDLAGSNGVATASGGPRNSTLLRVNSTTSTANLQGFTAPNARPGDELVVMGVVGDPANAVTITDNETVTNAFQTTGGTGQTVDAETDIHVFRFDGTDWSQTGSGGGN